MRGIIGNLPRLLNRSALVFPNSKGKRNLRWPEKIFPAAVADAEIDELPLPRPPVHLRVMAGSGERGPALRDLGGWKTLSMVQRYSHLSPGHQQSAIERLATRKVEADQPKAAGSE